MVDDVTRDILLNYIHYDAKTGFIHWLARKPEHFFGTRCTADSAKAWNNNYAGKAAFTVPRLNGYLAGGVLYKKYLAHRVVWFHVHGKWPDEIDHINGVRHDNRLCNLRSVNKTQNSKNKRAKTTNPFQKFGVGLYKRTGKYRAYIGNGKHLGYFNTLEEAENCRDFAEKGLEFTDRHGWG